MSFILIFSICSVEVFASTQNIPHTSNIIIEQFEEISDSELLLIRAKENLHDTAKPFNTEARYYDASSKAKTILPQKSLSTTQLLSTKLVNGDIVKSYAHTSFIRSYTSSAVDPNNILRVTIYYETSGGLMKLLYSNAILLTTSNYMALEMRNEVYEGMGTDITHSNTRTFQPPTSVNRLDSPTSMYVGAGLSRLSCFARLYKFGGSYVELYASYV